MGTGQGIIEDQHVIERALVAVGGARCQAGQQQRLLCGDSGDFAAAHVRSVSGEFWKSHVLLHAR